VLNAKYHQHEAEIVSKAGLPGTVTIATNMAGRGTDIKLGAGVTDARTIAWLRSRNIDPASIGQARDPNLEIDIDKADEDTVLEVGGLHIIGSSRHESRRIDRQLRGRAGRQGDPGASQFFLSLEDDLMRMFNSEKVAGIMERMGAEEGEVITHALVTRSISGAQKRVEGQNFEARKRLLEYDDVMNQQREVIYDRRLFALEGGEDLKAEVWETITHTIDATLDEFAPDGPRAEDWDFAGLRNRMILDYYIVVEDLPKENDPENPPFDDRDELHELITNRVRDAYRRKLESFADHQEGVLSFILLSVIDQKWRDHLYDLDHLKASINFRSWGQKDPLVEYKQDAYTMFVDMMADLRKAVATNTFRTQLAVQPPQRPQAPRRLILSGPGDGSTAGAPRAAQPAPQAPPPAPADPLAAAMAGSQRVSAPVGTPPGPDVRNLRTNRDENGGPAKEPVRVDAKVGRNDACPCGSGRKYKKCCGAAG
jgi:preprotein translocase subunit SecA